MKTAGRRPHGLTEQLARLDLADLIERERSHGPEAALATEPCHRCPWGSQTRCDQEWKQSVLTGERPLEDIDIAPYLGRNSATPTQQPSALHPQGVSSGKPAG